MRVLLLGANGQLGSDIVSAHAARNPRFEMIPLTRREIDVSNPEGVMPALEQHSFDVLINCTSYHKTDEVEKNGTLAFAINAHAVREMARLCARKSARFVHISTDYVFSGDSRQPYVETDCPRPVNVYGTSKAMGETLAFMAHDRVQVLRVASLFGIAGASGKGGNFVETMLKLAREKGEVRVVKDIVMSPTSTADVASMVISLIERNPDPGIYHSVNSGEASWYEFAREIISRVGIAARTIPVTSAEFPTVARRPAYSVLDNSKVVKIVGDVPHWTDALERYLRTKGHIH